MSTKKINNLKEKEILESSVIEKKRNNKVGLYILLSFIGLFCAVVCFVVLINKKEKLENSTNDKVIQYQLISYDNYNFKMNNDWTLFNGSEIKNNKETMHISLSTLDVPFEEFTSSEYQKEFLESYQTDNNLIINKTDKEIVEDKEYFYMDGFSNSYNYYVVVIGDENKVVLISSEFIDKITYTDLKQDLIDFALSKNIRNEKR